MIVTYSFIIPVKAINAYIREAIPKILAIPRNDFEIIVYPDAVTDEQWEKTRQIATGPGGPAMKRSLALRDARESVFIFMDDDAYPDTGFLDALDRNFSDPNVIAVGGPAMTPSTDSFWQKVSGAVFLSTLSGGYPERYVPKEPRRPIDDWPSVNLSVRRSAFAAVGGFQSAYWPGEDTKLCMDLLEKKFGIIMYDPAVRAWHHRREGFFRHLRQVGSYGIHRGYFAKKYPATSLRLKYFFPSFFLLFFVLGGIAIFFSPLVRILYGGGLIVYALALSKAFFDIRKYEKTPFIALHALYYIFSTHLFYGARFLQGLLFTRKLKSSLR